MTRHATNRGAIGSAIFLALLREAKMPMPVAEHRFHETRKWRFDHAWPQRKIALEVEGGIWSGGRHTRGAGYLKDCEKYNCAAVAGWCVLRVTPQQLATADTLALICAAWARPAAV